MPPEILESPSTTGLTGSSRRRSREEELSLPQTRSVKSLTSIPLDVNCDKMGEVTIQNPMENKEIYNYCMCKHYRVNVYAELLPSNVMGVHRKVETTI